MLMATAIGMLLFALPWPCMGEIPASLTLGGSTPTSNLPRGPNLTCSAFGCISTRRGGGLLDHGRDLRPLGASLDIISTIHYILIVSD